MNNFCTNCGHANNKENRICVECGSPIEVEQQAPVPRQPPLPKKPKKPMTFKAKLLTVVSVVILASLVGFYSWGTNTASAETAVSKFFEALQEKDAPSLRKYLVLSNGKKITEKEAEAFIKHYEGISPDELNEMATVEKNGKFAGVFDAHKIILDPQNLIFQFPYEGLKLKLGGEEKQSEFSDDGWYSFSGIVPGRYEAEFAFDNGETVFDHPFELAVDHQDDPAYSVEIDEYLPLGNAVLRVEVGDTAPINGAKVVIGEQEYPLNEYGETEEIGPFLLDGSMAAKAHVEFPWGTAVSEATSIEGEYINIPVTKIDEEIEEEVLEAFMAFLEENLEAAATKDASVYTFLTPGMVKAAVDEFEDSQSADYYFRGSLTKVNLDGESISFWSDGIRVDAEVISEAENYYKSDASELETNKAHHQVDFAYDSGTEKWVVKEHSVYNHYSRSFTLEPIRSIEGSQKLYEYKGSTASAKEKSAESENMEEVKSKEKEESANAETKKEEAVAADGSADIEVFMNNYNSLSSSATLTGDFSIVSHLITQNGPKRKESIDYIASVFSRGVSTEHLGTSVDKVETIDANHVRVTTTETFIIHGTEKSSEKTYRTVNVLVKNGNGWLVNELISTKEK